MPSDFLEAVAVAGDHLVQAADVGVDVKAGAFGGCRDRRGVILRPAAREDLGNVVLYIAAQAFPAFLGPAERGEIVEVVPLSGNLLEVFPVIDSCFVTGAINEPEIAALAAVLSIFGEKVLDESEDRGDAGSGGNHDAVGERLAQREEAVRSMKLNGLTNFEIAEEIRKKSTLHTIHTQVQHVGAWRRGNGVCACLRFPPVIDRDTGDELTGNEVKMRKLIDRELEVIALRGIGEQQLVLKLGGKERFIQSDSFPLKNYRPCLIATAIRQ